MKVVELIEAATRAAGVQNRLNSDACVLDAGCGNGTAVKHLLDKGFNAYGTDIEFKPGEFKELLIAQGRILKLGSCDISRIDTATQDVSKKYIWPFQSEFFDLVCSRATLEHVFNLEDFAFQNSRVLKHGGMAIHYFPSKYSLIEPHVGVPFGGILRNYWYIRFCVSLGLCFKKYRCNNKHEASVRIQKYLKGYTCYRNLSQIIQVFQENKMIYHGAYPQAIMQASGLPWAKRLAKWKIFAAVLGIVRSNVLIFSSGVLTKNPVCM